MPLLPECFAQRRAATPLFPACLNKEKGSSLLRASCEGLNSVHSLLLHHALFRSTKVHWGQPALAPKHWRHCHKPCPTRSASAAADRRGGMTLSPAHLSTRRQDRPAATRFHLPCPQQLTSDTPLPKISPIRRTIRSGRTKPAPGSRPGTTGKAAQNTAVKNRSSRTQNFTYMYSSRASRIRQLFAIQRLTEKIGSVLEGKKCKKPLGNWVLALTR